MKKIFTDHPNSMGETYFQHMKIACLFGSKMVFGGFACIIHAIFPFIFKKTGSDILLNMLHEFIERMPCIESRILRLYELIAKKSIQEKTVLK
jgi:hypothetical protein